MNGIKVLAQNKKARHEFFIEDRYEAGIALVGTEVKSCRMGKVNLRDAYAQVKNAEAFVHNMHISPYEKGNIFNRDPLRVRKLLLHKKEIAKLLGLTAQKGYTLVPLSMYLKNGKVKVEVGVARGKHLYDKRHDLKEKATRRDMQRAMKR
ncbi:MAG TPA: SsrA-binding protein [Clostridiales bacterium]|nr:SsrA-binding protein [Clostridiales bacterium]